MAALPPRLSDTRPPAGWRPGPLTGLLVGVLVIAGVASGGDMAGAGTGQTPAATAGTPARRIVSFVPAVTEMLFAIGAGDRVVGVSTYDRFPEAATRLPRVGGLLDPNAERLLSLRPDLVIVYGTQRDLRVQLDRARIPQFEYVHRDLADVTQTIRAVGRRIGAAAAAERAATDLERQLDAIRQRVAGRPRPRTLLVFGREAGSLRRIQASGGYGFLHDLLQLAGGEDVMGDVRRESVEMSTETVLARAPDVIVEVKYGRTLSAPALARLVGEWDPLSAVPAVQRRQVYVLQGDEFVIPGPRLVEAARALAQALHPTAPQ